MDVNNSEMEGLIENIESIKMNLENNINFAVMWLSETLDFLNNGDTKMALWSYSQYMKVLDKVDLDLYKKSGKTLYQKIEELAK